MNRVMLLAAKEVKRKLLFSMVIGGFFGAASALAASGFLEEAPLISYGISVLVLNFALFLLGGDIVAGEKTRGTFSFLLTLPLRDTEVVLGKLAGLAMMISPAILVNAVLVSSRGGYPDVNVNYVLALFLYLLFSASLLLLASTQFQRLPAIFLAFIFYHAFLAVPGAIWLSRVVVTPEPAPIFPVFLTMFSFFTPLLFGGIEYLSAKMPFLVSQVIAAGGPGATITMLENMAADRAFALVNLFSPLWQSSLYLLSDSRVFNVYGSARPLAVLSILLTMAGIILMASLQLRHGKRKVIPLFLVFALSPAVLGVIAPPGKIDLTAKTGSIGMGGAPGFPFTVEPSMEAERTKALEELGVKAGTRYRADERICDLQRRAEEAFLKGDIEETLRILEVHRTVARQRNYTEAVKLIDEIMAAMEKGKMDRILILGPALQNMYEGCG